jgi:hypothetical protein
MFLSIQKSFKKVLKPVAKIIASLAVWLLLLIYFHKKNKRGNYIPVLLASLCFNGFLIHIINPELIKYHIADPDSLPENLFVWDGQWDKDIMPLENHEKYKMMKELFIDKKEFKDTEFYSYAIDRIAKEKPINRGNLILGSAGNIEMYFEKTVRLFRDIKNNGFDLNLAPETGVAIDRDGNLIHFRQGHHTLAIAKFLGIKNVRVRIRAVHSMWLEKQVKGKKALMLDSIASGFKGLFE